MGSNHEVSVRLLQLSKEQGLEVKDDRFAKYLDSTIKWSLRDQFHIPTISEMLGDDVADKGTYRIHVLTSRSTFTVSSYTVTL